MNVVSRVWFCHLTHFLFVLFSSTARYNVKALQRGVTSLRKSEQHQSRRFRTVRGETHFLNFKTINLQCFLPDSLHCFDARSSYFSLQLYTFRCLDGWLCNHILVVLTSVTFGLRVRPVTSCIVGRNDLSGQFRKKVIRYKRTKYNMNVIRQGLHVWWLELTQSRLTASLPSLIPRRRRGSGLKTFQMVEAWFLSSGGSTGVQLLDFCCSSV